jgi:hypothetical protein
MKIPHVIERVSTWAAARERQEQLRLSGYASTATDMGADIALIITGGKSGKDLAARPKPTDPLIAGRKR